MLKVAVDLDGVCFNFIEPSRAWILSEYDFDIFPPLEAGWTHPDRELCEKYIIESIKPVFAVGNLPVLEDANISLPYLNIVPGLEFIYLTSRHIMHKDMTERALISNGFPNHKIVFSSEKGKYCAKHGIDFIIEDQLKHVNKVLLDSPGTQVLLVDAIYNQEFEGHHRVKRVKNWGQISFSLMFPRRLRKDE